MPNFWRTGAPRSLKIQWFPLSILFFGQKSCFLGPTIFKIPQPNWHYYVLWPLSSILLLACSTALEKASQFDKWFSKNEEPFSKLFFDIKYISQSSIVLHQSTNSQKLDFFLISLVNCISYLRCEWVELFSRSVTFLRLNTMG